MNYAPGDDVLIRARVTDDGHCLRLSPGVEILLSPAIQIATEIPKFDDPQPVFLVLAFANDEDRQDFAETIAGVAGVEAREI